MASLPIISADSHAEEPYELFQRLPREYRERAPRIEERADGVYVIQEGQRPIRQDVAAGKLTEEDKRREFRNNESHATGYGRESGTNVALRLADIKEDGVQAEVIYPQAIFKILASPDPNYQMAFARMYNDWYAGGPAGQQRAHREATVRFGVRAHDMGHSPTGRLFRLVTGVW